MPWAGTCSADSSAPAARWHRPGAHRGDALGQLIVQLAGDVAALGGEAGLHALGQLALGVEAHVVIHRRLQAVGHAVEGPRQSRQLGRRKARQAGVEAARAGAVEGAHHLLQRA
jgi:hypothetical protein